MLRRELLSILGQAAAVTVLAPLSPEERLGWGRRLHASLVDHPGMAALDRARSALVAELADLILPRTDTPGANDVRVVEFIDRILAFWDTAEERDRFLAGLDAIQARAGSGGLAALSPEQQATLLGTLDNSEDPAGGSAEEAWARVKSMVVYGYFTSKEVQQTVLKTVILPGRYDGCVPAGG
jgi:hypothetical protein